MIVSVYAYLNGDEPHWPPRITHINGQDVTQYLTQFAAINSVGLLEPHAEWNQLMLSPAAEIQNIYSVWGGSSTFYPGSTLDYTLSDGNVTRSVWKAIYRSPGYIGPLTTGGDFYNYFVLGHLPASYDVNFSSSNRHRSLSTSSKPPANLTSWHSKSMAYPSKPAIRQDGLGVTGAGVLTGYFLADVKTAVLSIPR